MKILWINEKADFVGGCESYVANTAALLANEGVENILLYSVEGWTEPSFVKNFEQSFPLVEPLRQIKEIEPDIIYVHRLTDKKFMREILQSDIPVVIFYHDHQLFCLREHKYKTISHKTCTKPIGARCYPCLGFVNKIDKFPKLKFRTHFALSLQQRWHKKAQAFVVASQYMKEHLIAHGYDPSKIIIAPLYSVAYLDKSPQFPQNGKLLFVGQILRGKGIEVLLKAMIRLPVEISCTFCGGGHQLHKFNKMAKNLGLADRVNFVGRVESVKLEKLYAEAEMVIVPSITPETFGLVGLEAMSFAKPVVAANVGGISMWLQHNENGLLFSSGNSEELAQAIIKLHKEPELRENMGKKGQKILQEKFRPQQHLQKIIQLFHKLVENYDELG